MPAVLDRPASTEIPTVAPTKIATTIPDPAYQIAHLLDTPLWFREWLISLEPKTQVGYSGHPNSCPLHTFYKRVGYVEAHVGTTTIAVMMPYPRLLGTAYTDLRFVVPQWARKFIDMVDRINRGGPATRIGEPVNAGEALEILDFVTTGKY